MNGLRVTTAGRELDVDPGGTVTVGRASDNDIVINDPTVSRHHVRIHDDGRAWVLEAIGSRPTFIGGAPVTTVPLTADADVRLVTPAGPSLRLELLGAPAPVAGGPAPFAGAAPVAPPAGGFPPPGGAPAPPAGRGFPPPGAPPPPPAGRGFPRPGAPPPPGRPGPMPGPGDIGPKHGPSIEGDLVEAVSILFPLRSWFHEPGWRQGFRLLVVPYALLPCIYLALFANSVHPDTPGWAYALYIAPLWAIAFWFLIRPGRITHQVAIVAAVIAAIVYVWIRTITVSINDHLNPTHLGQAIAVGFNEECTKALPVLIVAVFLLKAKKIKWDVRIWMWLGTISGLTFGVIEASEYTSNDVVTIVMHPDTVIVEILSFAERVFVDGYQHAIWAGISCFFIGLAVNYPRRRIPLVIIGIAMAAILHAANDYSLAHFSSFGGWITVQTVSLLIFLGYTMSASVIVRNVRRSTIFRGDSLQADPPSAIGQP